MTLAPQERVQVAPVVVVALVVALIGALLLRLAVAGEAGVRSPLAGIVFAIALAATVLWARRGGRVPAATGGPRAGLWASLAVALGGTAVLCAVPLLVRIRGDAGALGLDGFWLWAVVVTAVAVGEEALLRGVLWRAVAASYGDSAALGLTTVAFGLLHVPLYGLQALPLDLAVGLLLGSQRMLTGRVAVPAATHTLADFAGWFLR